MEVTPQIGKETPAPVAAGLVVTPRITMKASVPVGNQRQWQRKWRDVQHAYDHLVEAYNHSGLNDDDLTRRIESFFKMSRELADWIDPQEPGVGAEKYVSSARWLKIGDGIAQTAKHHTRTQGKDPITAKVTELFLAENGPRADIEWTSNSDSGKRDALALADDCLAEWRAFFTQHRLDPNG